MYLKRLYIKNYKSIKELDLCFSKGKNIIIGKNNTGKSNIINAIHLLLGEKSPTYDKSNNITDDDFYTYNSSSGDIHTADEIFIWCELERDYGEELNYEEMSKCYGYSVYSEIIEWITTSYGKNVPIKEPIRILNDTLPATYSEIFQCDEDTNSWKEYVNPKKRDELKQKLGKMYQFAFGLHFSKDNTNEIIKKIRFLYREDSSEDWILAFKAPIRNELIQSAIIPSFRDPYNQLRLTNWTWYGKLMQHLTAGHNESEELKDAFDRMKNAADNIFKDIKEKLDTSSMDVAFPGTELHFQFNADKNKDLYKNCIIYVDDGFKSQLTEKGSGIQSATIIGLFNYYTQYVNTITSALLCIEEPELYLHPHARRVINGRLDNFLDNNNNQVILSTHSVDFIKTVSDTNIILVGKEKDGSKATLINTRDFKHLLINNNQNELFFADKIIICEGYDEYILRFVANELFPKKLDEQNVSIVSVGGKNSINLLADIILKLGIKCFVFADFDYLLRDKSDARNRYHAKAHENVTQLGEKFFIQECIFGHNGGKEYSNVQRIRSKIKNKYEAEFYTAKTASCIPDSTLLESLKKLRQNGIGILSGEIENCSQVPKILSAQDNKLNLDVVYKLSACLAAGKNMTDMLDTNEIKEFLEVVFER